MRSRFGIALPIRKNWVYMAGFLLAASMVLLGFTASSVWAIEDISNMPTSRFLSHCRQDGQWCTSEIDEYLIESSTIAEGRPSDGSSDSCYKYLGKKMDDALMRDAVRKDETKMGPGTTEIVDWLAAHPEWNNRPTMDSFDAAVDSIWPCSGH